MEKEPSIWARGWQPASFLFITLFLAADLTHDVVRGTVHARHLWLDVLSLTVAFLAFAASARQSRRAVRRAREAAAAHGAPGSGGR